MKEVEKFRLSKEQVGFMKSMGRLNRIKKMISEGPLKKWYADGDMLKRLFGQLNEKQQMIQANAPNENLEELPGQPAENDQGLFDQGGGQQPQGMGGGQPQGMGQNQNLVR
jgi:hypothetical protein